MQADGVSKRRQSLPAPSTRQSKRARTLDQNRNNEDDVNVVLEKEGSTRRRFSDAERDEILDVVLRDDKMFAEMGVKSNTIWKEVCNDFLPCTFRY